MKNVKFLMIALFAILALSCSQERDFENLDLLQKNELIDCVSDDCLPIDDPIGGGPGGTGSNDWDKYFYTHRGESNHNIYYATSDFGTAGSWTTAQLGLGAKSSEGPASVIFNGKRILYYKGSSSNNIFYAYQNSPSSSWQGNSWINYGSKTDKAISADVFNNKVFVAFRGESHHKALYLAYSSTGTGTYTQIAVPYANEKVKEFAVVAHGAAFNVFWTRTDDDAKKIYRMRCGDPTNVYTWQYMGTIEGINGYNGFTATSLGDDIFLGIGIREKHPTNNLIQYRKVAMYKLGVPSALYVFDNYRTQRRPGIMVTQDSKLLISFAGESTDRINTMKVDTNGNILIPPSETGGETKVGGVFSLSIY